MQLIQYNYEYKSFGADTECIPAEAFIVIKGKTTMKSPSVFSSAPLTRIKLICRLTALIYEVFTTKKQVRTPANLHNRIIF